MCFPVCFHLRSLIDWLVFRLCFIYNLSLLEDWEGSAALPPHIFPGLYYVIYKTCCWAWEFVCWGFEGACVCFSTPCSLTLAPAPCEWMFIHLAPINPLTSVPLLTRSIFFIVKTDIFTTQETTASIKKITGWQENWLPYVVAIFFFFLQVNQRAKSGLLFFSILNFPWNQ